jgi:hypothetical protein
LGAWDRLGNDVSWFGLEGKDSSKIGGHRV